MHKFAKDLVHTVLRQPVKVLVGRKRKCDSFKRENEPQLTVQVSRVKLKGGEPQSHV